MQFVAAAVVAPPSPPMQTRLQTLLLVFLIAVSRAELVTIGSDGATAGVSLPDVTVGAYIRSDDPGSPRPNRFLLAGELDSNRGSMRGVLSFDLAAIPAGATITSATVSLFQDKSTAGRGAFRPVDIELFSMGGAVTTGATWNNTAGQFQTSLASVPGNTRTVALNEEFAFASPALTQYVASSLAGGSVDLGVMVPQLEALSNLPTGEYFIFDGPDAVGYSNSTDSIGPSLRVEFDVPGGNGTSPEGSVVINEIHCNPDLPYELVEFVELYNSKDEAIDLAGWSLARGVGFTFPQGATIGAGEYLVVTEDASARTLTPTTSVVGKYGTDPALIYGPFSGGLSNSGEVIELRDQDGVEVDQVDYGHGFPWPTVGEGPAGDGSGHSMQLVQADLDNDLAGSWRSASPTPGGANVGVLMANLPPQIRQVQHSPEQPSSTDTVTVTAKVTDADTVGQVELLYQVVAPGSYVRLGDAAYDDWTVIAMNDDGTAGDVAAGDDTYSVELPAPTRGHRNLVRYRIRATDAAASRVTVPYADDPQPNFAVFVYDGIPAWTGASDGEAATTFPAEVMASMRPYHLIANRTDVERCQYNSSFGETRFNGTLVYDGRVYDHIEFKIRGQGSTYLSGKNKWKFFFNRGHDFEARDDYGKKYAEPWRVLSVNACASPYNANHRGSSGIDEALGFRLFNLAGVPAPRTHYFQLRVIDDAVEASPTDQYEGDLWGLYLATEFPDGRFLDEHGLPDGNTYKMEGGGDKKHQGETQAVNSADLNSFRSSDTAGQSVAWWQANLDLESYFAFRAVNQIISNLDMSDTRNFYWYHNSATGRWTPIPWDIDNAYLHANSDHVRIDALNCLNRPEIKLAYDNYVRELQDLLFTREQTSALIDELASILEPPGLARSIVDVDHFMWNYHPRTRTTSVFPHRGGFFRNPATRTSTSGAWSYSRTLASADFEGMMHFFKDFVAPPAGAVTTHTSTWEHWNGWELHASQFDDDGIPATPSVSYTGVAGFPGNGLIFETSPFSDPGGSFGAMRWRIAEIAPHSPPLTGAMGEPAKRGKYEIDAVWESADITGFASDIQIPASAVEAGRTYRVRCKMMDDTGRWSHWSAPVEFTAGPADVSVWKEHLVVSEFMYHPPVPDGDELAASGDKDDFEYIELWNTSDTVSLDLSELAFTDGVEFEFAGSGVSTLGPGELVLVVKDQAAFEARYGTGLPIAGEFSGRLSNGGERVELSFAGNHPIHAWTYDDVAPWPVAADGEGATVSLLDPLSAPDHAMPESWTAGTLGGTPGRAPATFEGWRQLEFTAAQLADPSISGPDADPDGDGRSNFAEWALATQAQLADPPGQEFVWIVEGDLRLPSVRFRRPVDAAGVIYELMISGDLISWEISPAVPEPVGVSGDGVEQALLRGDQAEGEPGRRKFLRIRLRTAD